MRTTFPTFSPTRDHKGQTPMAVKPLQQRQLASPNDCECTSDPKSAARSRGLGTTADYGPVMGIGPGPSSPLGYTSRYTGRVPRGTSPNVGGAL